MKPSYKGLIVAALQIALVASLGGKLLYDRATRPRVWARTANYDPDLPIRGRYVSLRVEVTPQWFNAGLPPGETIHISPRPVYDSGYRKPVKLEVKDEKLEAILSNESEDTGVYVAPQLRYVPGKNTTVASEELYIDEPVAFFIPEHANNPARLNPGEELWVEVTVPQKGPPRPIRLAIKKDGILTPLHFE